MEYHLQLLLSNKMLKIKDVAVFFLVIGVILSFIYLPAGIISISTSLVMFVFNYVSSRISSSKNSKEHQGLISLIQETNNSKQKLECLKELFKKENINIRKLTTKFDTPLWSIFIFKWGEQPRYSKIIYEKKLLIRIREMGFQIVANGLYFLPPNSKSMPIINKNFDIEKWTNNQIISKLPRNIPYTIKLICPIDLRQVFGYKITNYGETIFDLLIKNDKKFLEKILIMINPKKISLGTIAQEWELGDIITIPTNKEIINNLNRNSKKILQNINCSSVLDICLVENNKLILEIKQFAGDEAERIIKNIKENSLSLREVK